MKRNIRIYVFDVTTSKRLVLVRLKRFLWRACLWHVQEDRVERGQFINGILYPHHVWISSDSDLMANVIYQPQKKMYNQYLCVSKMPFFTAVLPVQVGTGAWMMSSFSPPDGFRHVPPTEVDRIVNLEGAVLADFTNDKFEEVLAD